MHNYNPQYPPPPQWNQPYPHGRAYQPYAPQHPGMSVPVEIPEARSAQICGIIGLCLFFNIIGIVLNIIAVIKGGRAISEFHAYPGRFTEESLRKAKSGRTCGIIGLSLFGGGLFIVFLIALALSV